MMKKTMTALAMLATTMVTQAADYDYLTLQTADGNLTSVATKGLVITFDNGQLTATTADGQTTLTLDDLKKMYFSTTDETTNAPTAITQHPTPSTQDGVTVYTLQGTLAGHFSSLESARQTLKRGVYVVTIGGDTRKFIVK